MSDRRWRDGNGPSDRREDDQADRGAWPGKRSMVSGHGEDVASRWPGKRSITQGMRMGRQTTATGRPVRTMGDIAQETIDRKGSGQPLDAGLKKRV
ncbi:MAG TPA: hypothetical protein VGO00_20730, partial [Kofleriaceae bacterium]|nr:hypothetical protein [Kofleriaceae bacterium]